MKYYRVTSLSPNSNVCAMIVVRDDGTIGDKESANYFKRYWNQPFTVLNRDVKWIIEEITVQ